MENVQLEALGDGTVIQDHYLLSACVSHKNIDSFAARPQAPTEMSLLGTQSSKVSSYKVNPIGKSRFSIRYIRWMQILEVS
jgi:hypothetical protein